MKPAAALALAYESGLDRDNEIFAYVGVGQMTLDDLLIKGQAQLPEKAPIFLNPENTEAKMLLADQEWTSKRAYQEAAGAATYRMALRHLERRYRNRPIKTNRDHRLMLAKMVQAIFRVPRKNTDKLFIVLDFAELNQAAELAGLNLKQVAKELRFLPEQLADAEGVERESFLRFFNGLPQRAGYILGIRKTALNFHSDQPLPLDHISLRNLVGVEPLSLNELKFLEHLSEPIE